MIDSTTTSRNGKSVVRRRRDYDYADHASEEDYQYGVLQKDDNHAENEYSSEGKTPPRAAAKLPQPKGDRYGKKEWAATRPGVKAMELEMAAIACLRDPEAMRRVKPLLDIVQLPDYHSSITVLLNLAADYLDKHGDLPDGNTLSTMCEAHAIHFPDPSGAEASEIKQLLDEAFASAAEPDYVPTCNPDYVRDIMRRYLEDQIYRDPELKQAGNGVTPDGLQLFPKLYHKLLQLRGDDNGPSLRRVGDVPKSESQLPETIVEGYSHRREVTTITAGTTEGKSWLLLYLCLCVIRGARWLGKYQCRKGRALFVDYELGDAWLSDRLRLICQHLGWGSIWKEVEVFGLRKNPRDIHQLEVELHRRNIKPRDYSIIVVDPFKDSWPDGTDPNAAGSMKAIMAKYRTLADDLETAIWVNCHPGKGDTSARSLTDLLAGSYVSNASADNFIGLFPHQEEGHVIMEARCRNLRQPENVVMRFDWPLWKLIEGLDSQSRRLSKNRNDKKREQNDKQDSERLFQILKENSAWRSRNWLQNQTGFNTQRITRLMRDLIKGGRVEEQETSRGTSEYRARD